MKLDKFIQIQGERMGNTLSGGSAAIRFDYWTGWANVREKNYSTVTQSGQYVGQKATHFTIRKNLLTEGINTTMFVIYRNEEYLIKDIIEIDSFHLSITAAIRERNTVQQPPN